MKKIFVVIVLLAGWSLTLAAQGVYELYDSYDLTEKEDNLSKIFRCDMDMNMSFGYLNMQWKNNAPLADPGFSGTLNTSHGFHYSSDFLLPVWGPLGINFRWLDLAFGFGKWDLSRLGMTADPGKTSTSLTMSLGLGIMPSLQFHFGQFWTTLFGGVKGYGAFFDGPDSYPLSSMNEKKRSSISNVFFANYLAGIDLNYKSIGFRFTYEWGWSQRMKDAFYNPETVTSIYNDYNKMRWDKQQYNPRYDMFTISFIYWFHL